MVAKIYADGTKECGCCFRGVRYDLITFGKKQFDGSRVAYLRKHLPNLQVIPASFGNGPIAFKFDGGEALLMGMVDK